MTIFHKNIHITGEIQLLFIHKRAVCNLYNAISFRSSLSNIIKQSLENIFKEQGNRREQFKFSIYIS